jgi:hypothetical protein
MLASYNAGRVTLPRAQQVAKNRSLDPTRWPSIETVAPSVPRWRYDETLSYLGRILANLSDYGRAWQSHPPSIAHGIG